MPEKWNQITKKKSLIDSSTQVAEDVKLITIPSVSILLDFEKVSGFPDEYDQQAMCSHLRESNCHYKVKKPKFTSKRNVRLSALMPKLLMIQMGSILMG